MSHNKVVRKKAERFKTIGGRRVSDKEAAEVKRTGFLAAQPTKKPKKSKGRSSGGGSKPAPFVGPPERTGPAPLPGFGVGTDIGTQFTDPAKKGVLERIATLDKLGIELPPGTQTGVAPIAGLGKGAAVKAAKLTGGFITKKLSTFGANKRAADITKISNPALKIGTLGISPKAVGILKTIAQNTKTTKIMTRWIAGIATLGGLTIAAVSLYKDIVGTKVFTGFLGEETIQNLGLAYNSAFWNDDFEGMGAALDMEQEVVDLMRSPDYITGLPYDEAIKAATTFAEAADLSIAIRRKVLDDKAIQLATGETEDAKFARIREEEAQEARDIIDIFNSERLINQAAIIDLNTAAAKAREGREREALLERIELFKQADIDNIKRAEAAAIANAEFWLAYHKELAKIKSDNAPSNLNFGLL